jgi:arsenite methyltransferase
MTELLHPVTLQGDSSARRSAGRRPRCSADRRVSRPQRSGAAWYSETQLRGAPPAAVVASTAIGNPFAAASPRIGQTVVDLGGGAGLDAIIAGRLVGPEGRVFLVDDNAFAICVARRNARHARSGNVACVHADMARVAMPSATADWVISNHALSFASAKAATVRHARRLLKPGGTLVCAMLVRTRAADRPEDCANAPLPLRHVERLLTEAGFARMAAVERRDLGADLAAVTVVGHTAPRLTTFHPETGR